MLSCEFLACGRGGLIVYQTRIPAAEMKADSVLNMGHRVHDAATVRIHPHSPTDCML
jgi:hypothetical protein